MKKKKYRLMTFSGMGMIVAGLGALMADAVLSGSIAVGTGSLLVMSAIAGSGWGEE